MATDAPLDDWSPLDPTQRQAQVLGLRQWLAGRTHAENGSVRVLDLGCGDGSVIESLLERRRAFTGLDRDPRARKAARKRLRDRRRVEIIDADFTDPEHANRWTGPFDLALCLGHTMMLVLDEGVAQELFRRLAERLAPGGALVIDNFPDELSALIDSGDWQTGLNEDGSCQMILDAAKRLIALRFDDEVDEECEAFKAEDRLHRLWTMAELRALAASTGFKSPRLDASHHLIWFDRS